MNKTTNALITKMKTAFFAGIAFGAGLLTSGLFAAAAAMNIFSAGDVISAAQINQNFQIAAPEGAVMAFFRTDCPEGWAAADGNNGTPDLRGQFIRGRDDAGTGAAGRDPDGVRGVGGEQGDAFQGHAHSVLNVVDGTFVIRNNGIVNPTSFSEPNNAVNKTSSDPVATAFGAPRFGSETRPKNVALTYCMRQN